MTLKTCVPVDVSVVELVDVTLRVWEGLGEHTTLEALRRTDGTLPKLVHAAPAFTDVISASARPKLPIGWAVVPLLALEYCQKTVVPV